MFGRTQAFAKSLEVYSAIDTLNRINNRNGPASVADQQLDIFEKDRLHHIRFQAMACPCEILIEQASQELVERIATVLSQETWRIEQKFSRFVANNPVANINQSNGQPVTVDVETARLLDFADQCYQLSEGSFDITSGSLGEFWWFKGQATLPNNEDIQSALKHVGWSKVQWRAPVLQMEPEMSIDLGGLGKEYAVDRCLEMAQELTGKPVLVNFGGDLKVSGSRLNDQAWRTGIEHPGEPGEAAELLALKQGALATSGDVYRFFEVDGKRYGHILDPRTGWPVIGAPRSVTVAAPSCTEAGFLSTLAMLHGADAEAFLDQQELPYWCVR